MCHSYETLTGITTNGDTVSLYVDGQHMSASVHGKADLGCSSCHADITGYPHGDTGQVACSQCHGAGGIYQQPLAVNLPYESARAMTVALNETCRRCHEEQFTGTQDSTHQQVFASGNELAPVCTDCHGSHDVQRPDQPRTQEVLICAKCHQEVYTSYRASVHGAALFDEQNTDVPTCITCHGVHDVKGPRDTSFRDNSITTCGGCHANKEMMAKYGISADVFQTYLDDFHGRTVNLDRQEQNALPSNQAVCYDCHGVHNILPPDNPDSTVNPANLMKTCQKCHADANSRFPSAWLGHKYPSFTSTPALYGVSWFYKLVIPATLGFFGVYIVLDVRKRRSEKRAAYRRVMAEALKETPQGHAEPETQIATSLPEKPVEPAPDTATPPAERPTEIPTENEGPATPKNSEETHDDGNAG
jgi:predicted CXXCH cytochrome family protein